MVQILHVTLQLPPPLTFIDPVRPGIILLVYNRHQYRQ